MPCAIGKEPNSQTIGKAARSHFGLARDMEHMQAIGQSGIPKQSVVQHQCKHTGPPPSPLATRESAPSTQSGNRAKHRNREGQSQSVQYSESGICLAVGNLKQSGTSLAIGQKAPIGQRSRPAIGWRHAVGNYRLVNPIGQSVIECNREI